MFSQTFLSIFIFPSFGVSELRKGEGARGWFKLLTQGEGEYYNVPVIAEEENVKAHIRKQKVRRYDYKIQVLELVIIQKIAEIQPKISRQDPLVPHNMKGKDVINAQDFNFLMLLGRGSFGKVSVDLLMTKVSFSL